MLLHTHSRHNTFLATTTILCSVLLVLLVQLSSCEDDSSNDDGVQVFYVKHPFPHLRKRLQQQEIWRFQHPVTTTTTATPEKNERQLVREAKAVESNKLSKRAGSTELPRIPRQNKPTPAGVSNKKTNESSRQQPKKQKSSSVTTSTIATSSRSSSTRTRPNKPKSGKKQQQKQSTSTTTAAPRKSRGFSQSVEKPLVLSTPGGYSSAPKRGYVYKPPTTTARGYVYKPPTTTERGYVYTKPTTTKRGYVYTTPSTTTTTTEPAIEADLDNEAVDVTPSPPPTAAPDRSYEEEVDLGPVELDEWDIRDAVPGSPGDDYPVHGRIPRTGFSCEGRLPGYYADTEARCQVFHRCSDCIDNVRVQMDSFLCPNGTQFNQEVLSCDWWGNVNCDGASNYYELNQEIGALARDGEYVQFSGKRVAPKIFDKKVAPTIIPKDRRRTLPAEFRNYHTHSDHGSGHGWQGGSSSSGNFPPPTRTPAPEYPTPSPQTDISFEFSNRPSEAPSSSSDSEDGSSNSIQDVLDNEDYFVADDSSSTTTTTTNAPPATFTASPSKDDDDLNIDAFDSIDPSEFINERMTDTDALLKESEESEEASSEASSSTTSTTPSTTTTTEKTTLKPAKIEFVPLQSKVSPRASFPQKEESNEENDQNDTNENEENDSEEGENPSTGFIVNRRPQELGSSTEGINSNELDLDLDITPPKDKKPGTFVDFDEEIGDEPDSSRPSSQKQGSTSSSASSSGQDSYQPQPQQRPPSQSFEQDSYQPPRQSSQQDSYQPPRQSDQQDSYQPPRKPVDTYGLPQSSYVPSKVVQYSPVTTTYYSQPPPVSGPLFSEPVPSVPVVLPASYIFGREVFNTFKSPSYTTTNNLSPVITSYKPQSTHFINPHLTYPSSSSSFPSFSQSTYYESPQRQAPPPPSRPVSIPSQQYGLGPTFEAALRSNNINLF